MDRVRLAYRDDDRTPMIFTIAEMARRHYDVDVEVLKIQGTDAFEATLFDDSADVLIEHLEFLYAEAQAGKKVTMFCAPVVRTGLELVVRPEVTDLAQLHSTAIAVRSPGRPTATLMRLRHLGLSDRVRPVIISDAEVGRWSQWKRVLDGACGGAFISLEYLPAALEAGLVTLPVADLPMVGHYAQACTAAFARANGPLLARYVSAVIHAACLIKLRPTEAAEIAAGEPARRMKLTDPAEIERRVRIIGEILQLKPYPSPQGLANVLEIALDEWPGGAGINPLTVWDLHWVKELDDAGFIDRLIAGMGGPAAAPAI